MEVEEQYLSTVLAESASSLLETGVSAREVVQCRKKAKKTKDKNRIAPFLFTIPYIHRVSMWVERTVLVLKDLSVCMLLEDSLPANCHSCFVYI